MIAVSAAAPNFHEATHLPALNYKDDYITTDGTERKEIGHLVPTVQVPIIQGEVSYIGDDGKNYTIQYMAGTNGYTAKGNHLPVAPAINDGH